MRSLFIPALAIVLIAAFATIDRAILMSRQSLSLEIASTSVALAQARLEALGPIHRVGDTLVAGGVDVGSRQDLADGVASLTGFGCTVFAGDLRIATTAREAGSNVRALGTRSNAEVRRTVLEEGGEFRGITRTIGKDWVIVYRPLRDAGGDIVGMVACYREWRDFVHDLLPYRLALAVVLIACFAGGLVLYGRTQQAMERLRAARESAENANEAKSLFLANMSHELRTPLNAVIGYAEMLADDALDEGAPERLEDLGRITRASRHLLGLIDDVLDLSKIEADRLVLEYRTFDLVPVLEDIAAEIKPVMARSRSELRVSLDPQLDTMRGDETRMRQVLLNLLGNAAKFTRNGQISLIARADGEHLRFIVEDTGVGMSESQLQRVFERFLQADSTTTRRFGGTGLGLTITRHLVRQMGGDIRLESAPGQGTRATVTVPRWQDGGSDLVGLPAAAHPLRPTEPDVRMVNRSA